MIERASYEPPHAWAEFRKSSSKDGGLGYTVNCDERLGTEEAVKVVQKAYAMLSEAVKLLAGREDRDV